MTETYRSEQLAKAESEWKAAKAAAEASKAKRGWTKKTAELFETVEFWSNKLSFLSNSK